jgi:kynurenine formamidase
MMKCMTAAAAAFAALALLADAGWAQNAQSWCKSKWGPNDEIGAANLITPESVAAAAKLVKTGKTYALGVETNAKTPTFGSRSWALVVTQPGQAGGGGLGPTDTNYNDDVYMGYVGTGSQLDGLGHIGVGNVYYNCHKNAAFVQANGLTKLGIEKVPPLVARGIVLDMVGLLGKGDPLPDGTAINKKEIEDALKRQKIEIKKGDLVLLHTGWLSLVGKDDKRYLSGEPGLGKEGAEYLVSKEVLAVGADSWGLEVIPFEKGVGVFEVHQILIPRNGIYILENMNTGPLVADQAWEFMFVLGHSRITGGVQAIINPVAIR